ncbi:unnamed protein product [Rotaria sp. Silwood2]|nr:unnamed protein product [Rotaria sp. Silwood2]CAF3129742.1 unnamed protein product [Rotaria sp. Silwood2]CAF3418598.1 unnamed protein product [Rotaria sp. Silwood2]CAF4321547.1 unnamed protein product [Rotaria sp. Silwood2]CAF4483667.1 unnamed protein product [Rotaria sp. Silwood2]
MNTIFKFLAFVFIIIMIYIIYYSQCISKSSGKKRLSQSISDNSYLPQETFSTKTINNISTEKPNYGRPNLAKYIHLDLKGAPPKLDKFYESFFNFLKSLQMGVKGVLIEYEDILPLEGIFADVGHQAGYTKSDIKLIEKAAKENEIEIIPLIQTFGHLEWILKLDKFKSYRDHPNLPLVISPCLNATYVLLQDLLQQTLDMHPNSNKIHIGCDEVMLYNVHDQCYKKQMNKSERYIDHIQRIVNIVHQIRPGIRVLIWDDILRHDEFTKNDKLLSQLKGLVEPVSWNYVPTFHDYYKTLSAWKIYPKLFNSIWAASAFKGGVDRFSMITNTTHHVLNNRQWLHFMQSPTFEEKYFSAIILTGWSRFDHFMPLCDILPTAYPSLLYSLHILNTDQFLADNPFYDCETLMKSIGKYSQLCKLLPSISIFSSISSLFTIVSKIQNLLKLLYDTSPEYNRKHSFVRRYELDSQLTELKGFQNDLLSSKERLNHDLSSLYSKDIIDEWFNLYVIPIENQIYKAYIDFSPVFNITSWVRRPLN